MIARQFTNFNKTRGRELKFVCLHNGQLIWWAKYTVIELKKQIAESLGVIRACTSMVLNGHRVLVGAKEKIRVTLESLKKEGGVRTLIVCLCNLVCIMAAGCNSRRISVGDLIVKQPLLA